MMIDTHCHLDIDEYENVDLVIKNMGNNIMIASGCNMQTNTRVMELIKNHENIYGTIGIHPNELDDMNEKSLKFLEENIRNSKIVGIGEIGLDYYWDKDHKEIQQEFFIKQIELAKKYNKPIVIHSREAANDTYNILEKYLGNNKAIMHCYSYSLDMAKKYQKLGVKFGIGGVITFKNSNKLKETVEELDISNFVLETDSPYLSPEPFRGQKNEPKNVYLVAQKIAEIKNLKLEKVLETTTKNAIDEFDLDIQL